MASETTIISMREDFAMLVELLKPIWTFIDEHEALTTGLLAFVAAAVTIIHLRKQIKLQKNQFDWEKQRAQKISRLKLSHALSELSDYYEECIKAWKKENAKFCPKPPKNSIDAVIDAGANADQTTFGVFNEIANRLQYFNSRITGSNVDYPTMLIDLVFLQHYTNQLFDYARFEVDKVAYEFVDLESFNRITRSWELFNFDEITIDRIKSVMPELGGLPIRVKNLN